MQQAPLPNRYPTIFDYLHKALYSLTKRQFSGKFKTKKLF